MLIRAVGIDAAFANMGFAQVEIDGAGRVDCLGLYLVTTEAIEDRKVVRKSSTELRRAQELCKALAQHTIDRGAQFAFVEVPSGSQSASAARALGIAVGVLGSCQVPIIEVSPMEVKRIINPDRKVKVSKLDVIKWAMQKWPQAPWILHRNSGKTFKKGEPQNCNEHLADAMATVMAGIATPEFQRLMTLMAPHATTSPTHFRPTPDFGAQHRIPVGRVRLVDHSL